MQFQFSFKQMEKSSLISNYAQKKLADKIQKFVMHPIELNITFSKDKYNFITKCSFVGSGGINVDVQHSGTDIYGCIDKLADKLLAQVKKQKSKNQSLRFRPSKISKIDNSNVSVKDLKIYDDEYIDAEDMLKFEQARQKFLKRLYS